MGALIGAFLVTHTPRMAEESQAPPFTHEMIRGMRELAQELARLKPDVIIQVSTHWVTTFNHYVLGHGRHRGVLTSSEAPDLIAGVPYDFPGDPETAEAIVGAGVNSKIPVVLTAADHFVIEYGTLNPLRYLTPRFDVSVVPISSCLLADLDESVRWGQAIAEGVKQSARRVLFVASGSCSHALVRGPERWPAKKLQKLDHQFVDLLTEGRGRELRSFLPEYVKTVEAEMGGRHLAVLLGVTGGIFRGKLHAYGPSSGSGNPIVSLFPPR